MRIAETITNRYMAVVVSEGAILDERTIDKLISLGYQKLRVFAATEEEIKRNSIEIVKAEYRENLDVMKTILHDMSQGKKLDMPTVSKVTSMMYERQDNYVGVFACLNQLRSADEYTYSHCLNVAYLCMFIAKWLSLKEEDLQAVLQAGLLHDLGKCRIPEYILNKPAPLTEDEFQIIKKHPAYGFRMLEHASDVRPTSAIAALTHHEKMNGKGYPIGMKGERIHLYGKITAIADIYDAMTSNRCYHKKNSPFQVFGILEELMYGSLDPQLVLVFLKNLAGYYVGDRIRLSNGVVGTVVFINPRSISKPVVQVSDSVVDLADPVYKDLFISDIL